MVTDYLTLLLRGRGAALIRAAEATPDQLLDSCTRFTGYDSQVDGNRAEYLFDVLVAAGLLTRLEAPILQSLPDREGVDRQQLLDLAVLFAFDGSTHAANALRDTFLRCRDDPERPGAMQWLRAAGLDALPRIASELGHALPAEGAGWPEGSILELAETQFGADATADCLRRAAATDASISRLVDAVSVLRAEVSRQEAAGSSVQGIPPTFDAFVTAVQTAGRHRDRSGAINRPKCWRWARDAPERELIAAGEALAAATGDLRLSILRVFRERPLPSGPAVLFAALAAADERTVDAAWDALRHFRGPEIRGRAAEALRGSGFHRGAVRLLARELEEEDLPLLRGLLDSLSEEEDVHEYGMAVLDACEDGAGSRAVPLLLTCYDRGNCGMCREMLVGRLRGLGAAPRELLDECKFDAALNLRAAANAWQREGTPPQSKIS